MWIARHAESTWNAQGRWQGQGNPPLSERGLSQARALAERLAELRIRAIVSSDLARAAQTAGIAAERLGVPLHMELRLRERDVGTWSGLAHQEIARRFPDELARLRTGDLDVRPGGGETQRELEGRVRAVFAEIGTEARTLPVAVITHLGVIRVLEPEACVENAGLWNPGQTRGRQADRGALF